MPIKVRSFTSTNVITGMLTTLCIALGISSPAAAQNISTFGTDFWTVYAAHIDETGSNMNLYISAVTATSGTVSIPLKGYSVPFTVGANSVTIINVPSTIAYLDGSEKVQDLGIHIKSAGPVAVFSHIYADHRSGSTILLPVPALGKEYYSMNYTQNPSGNNGGPGPGGGGGNGPQYSQFQIIAVEDNTTVEITPKQNTIAGKPANVPFRVQMNQGQVYQVQSLTDLSGSIIASVPGPTQSPCKPIAVFSGSSFDRLGCQGISSGDNLYQQLYPSYAWGKEFAGIPAKTRLGGDIFRVLGQTDNTVVTISGLSAPVTIGRGQIYAFQTDQPCHVTATEPITFAQYFRTQNCDGVTGDPEMIIHSPLEQGVKQVSVYSTPNYAITGHYINVVIKTADAPTFTLDGATMTFTPIAALSGYSYGQFTVNKGQHNLLAKGNFNAVAYGFGQVESYGYVAGSYINNLNQSISASASPACISEPITFSAVTTYTPSAYKWNFGDGSPVSTLAGPVHAYSRAGTYRVSLITAKSNNPNCTTDDSTGFTLTVQPPPTLAAGPDARICSNTPFSLSGKTGTGYTYSWSPATYLTGANTASPTFNYNNRGTSPQTFTLYYKAQKASGACPSTDSIHITVKPAINAEAGSPVQVCAGSSISTGNPGLPGYTYKWQPFPGLTNLNAAQATFTPDTTGNYPQTIPLLRTATLDTCSQTDTLLVKVNPKPKSVLLGSASVCPNVIEVSYWVQNPDSGAVYSWAVSGGVIVRNFNDSVIVTWQGLNQHATVKAIARNLQGCLGDTFTYHVAVEHELHTETPEGPTLLCPDARFGVRYKILGTNGSKYKWHITGGSFVNNMDSTKQVTVNWDYTGAGRLYISEISHTSTDYCTGGSDTITFSVDSNTTHPIILEVGTLPADEKVIILNYRLQTKAQYPALKTLDIFRKQPGQADYIKIATRPITAGNYLDSAVETGQFPYEYLLQVTNQCDSLIIGSPHQSILLTGKGDEEAQTVKLNWTAYQGWEPRTTRYKLLINNDSKGFHEKSEIGAGYLEYSADSAIEAFHQCYRIQANPEADTSVSSLSNIVCLKFQNPLSVPNVITPGTDGYNDNFYIKNLRFYPNTTVQIFNRWGENVLNTPDYQNGSFTGDQVPSGVYFYVIQTTVHPQSFKGFLQIIKK